MTSKKILFIAAIKIATTLQAQKFESFKRQELKKVDSITKALDTKNKLNILALAPSINYNVNTGVNVGFSLQTLINYKQLKRRNKLEIVKIKNELKNKIYVEIEKAEQKETEIKARENEILTNIKILKLHEELFKIEQEKYKNLDITFETFTGKKIAYLENYYRIKNKISILSVENARFTEKYKISCIDTTTLIKTIKNHEYKGKN